MQITGEAQSRRGGRAWLRFGVHAVGFWVVAGVLMAIGGRVDVPPGVAGGWMGAYGHELLLDVGIAITLAVSLNLILGMTGQFSLGHGGFLAAGAYTSALIAGRWFEPQLRFWCDGWLHLSVGTGFAMVMLTGVVAGAAVAAVLGLVVGLPTLRLRGDYLAIATLGFSEILVVVIQNMRFDVGGKEFNLGGPTGLSLTSMRGEWLGDQTDPDSPLAKGVQAYMDSPSYLVGFFWVFAVALVAVYVVHNIKYATSGRALLAIREDPIASESVGVPTTRYKVTAFVIGAALAGAAGGVLSHHKSLINPESFRFMSSSYTGSITLVAMVILGGQGSITGSALAAAALTVIPEVLRTGKGWVLFHVYGTTSIQPGQPGEWLSNLEIDKWRMVIYSLVIIGMMVFRPRGILGSYEVTDLVKWVWRKVRGECPVSSVQFPETQKKNEVADGLELADAGVVLVEARDVGMSFGGLRAVDGFSLKLRSGELVGLIGPNGAGKTTVFNVLTGVYRPTDGGIWVGGESIVREKPHQICRRGVARTFQNIRLFGNLSVLDNVQIAQHMHHKEGIPSAVLRIPAFFREEGESRDNAMGFLEIFKLDHLWRERAGGLSYGDQRRLEIARALATRPRVLLLDEPAAGMNPTEKRALMELIQDVRRQFGLTILIIEHDMKVIMGICERILVLDYGKTIAEGTPGEIRKSPAVIEAYLGASAIQG